MKTRDLGLDHVTGQNFHSFMIWLTGSTECCRDTGIIRYFRALRQPNAFSKRKQIEFTHLMVDECQDINETYFDVIKLVLPSVKQVMIVGDPRQSIFEFNNANIKYLLEPESAQTFNRPFETCYLRTTFRMTQHMVDFVNTQFLGNEELICGTGRLGEKVETIFYHPFQSINLVTEVIKKNMAKYGVDQIYILAPSTKSTNPMHPISKLVNSMSKQGYKFYVSADDDRSDDLHSDVHQNKLVISTYHKVKGCERSCVILFGFDTQYDKFYNKRCRQERPNAMYVALSRAISKLIIISADFYRTMLVDSLGQHADVHIHEELLNDNSMLTKLKESVQTTQSTQCQHGRTIKTSVVEMFRHLPSTLVEELIENLNIKQVRKPQFESHTNLNVKIAGNGSNAGNGRNIVENVSAIYGTSIVLYYEWNETGSIEYVETFLDNL